MSVSTAIFCTAVWVHMFITGHVRSKARLCGWSVKYVTANHFLLFIGKEWISMAEIQHINSFFFKEEANLMTIQACEFGV